MIRYSKGKQVGGGICVYVSVIRNVCLYVYVCLVCESMIGSMRACVYVFVGVLKRY